jgi:putative endonuclease
MNTRKIGADGEEKAVQYLVQKGSKIITRNFRKRGFEIDIVAVDAKKVLRFIEVKTVLDGSIEDAAYSIENRNIKKYDLGLNAFLSDFPQYIDHQMSMDVCLVDNETIVYYENITSGLVF